MKVDWIKSGLRQLKKSFRRILHDSAEYVIEEAIAGLYTSKERFDERTRRTDDPCLKPEPWGYQIYPERPLRFKPSTAIKGLSCWVDLYCTMLWWEEGSLPVKQEITLRVWSDELDYI